MLMWYSENPLFTTVEKDLEKHFWDVIGVCCVTSEMVINGSL